MSEKVLDAVTEADRGIVFDSEADVLALEVTIWESVDDIDRASEADFVDDAVLVKEPDSVKDRENVILAT